jgi:hypothetical protein
MVGGMVRDVKPQGARMMNMAKAQRSDAVWIEIDPTTLDAAAAKEYKGYKDMYAAMKAQRTAFEEAMSEAIAPPAGKRVVFGYNFGKLSVAVVDDDRKAKAATPTKLSLSDFMAMTAQQGKRV